MIEEVILKRTIRPRESVAESAHIIGKVSGKETEELSEGFLMLHRSIGWPGNVIYSSASGEIRGEEEGPRCRWEGEGCPWLLPRLADEFTPAVS